MFNHRLFVFIDNNAFDIDDLKISNQLIENNRILTIVVDGIIIFKKEYLAQTGYDVNLTCTTEEEDVDDFLWMSAVLNDIERREVIIKYLK